MPHGIMIEGVLTTVYFPGVFRTTGLSWPRGGRYCCCYSLSLLRLCRRLMRDGCAQLCLLRWRFLVVAGPYCAGCPFRIRCFPDSGTLLVAGLPCQGRCLLPATPGKINLVVGRGVKSGLYRGGMWCVGLSAAANLGQN